MKKSKKRIAICPFCLKEHEVSVREEVETTEYKGEEVEYNSKYLYCEESDSCFEDEEIINENDILIKDAYRVKKGLLRSQDIIDIRNKYGISQSDFCALLQWGKKTITRYEGHQVQDKAHDLILKKVSEDPSWYIELLVESKSSMSEDLYLKYYAKALSLYEKSDDYYLRKLISANCSVYSHNPKYTGDAPLSFSKIIDVIKYYSSSADVTSLYKVKLMKMMWYADFLSYKMWKHSITGLPYLSLPMGAVPESHDYLIRLKGVPCETKIIKDSEAYYFHTDAESFPALNKKDIEVLNSIISIMGKWDTSKIVDYMHKERAFTETKPNSAISYEYAKYLTVDVKE